MKATNREAAFLPEIAFGIIQIRSDGGVWRTAYRRRSRWDGTERLYPTAPKRIDPAVGVGYRQVHLTIGGRQRCVLAHRLVWAWMHGPIPAGLTINHKNGVKSDNRPENLELATYSEQSLHALRVLRVGRTDQYGEKNAMARLNAAAVREIRRRRRAGERLKVLAAAFGVSQQEVSRIARGQRWAFLG